MVAVPPLPSLRVAALRKLRASLAPPAPVRREALPALPESRAESPLVAEHTPRRWPAAVAGSLGALLISAGIGMGFLPAAHKKAAPAATPPVSSALPKAASSTISRPDAAAHDHR
jgi:hypothetical protein